MTTDDVVAIQQVINRVAYYNDSGQLAKRMAHFTEDCLFDYPPNPPVQGRDAVRSFSEVYAPVKPKGKHLLMNTVIDIDVDGSTAEAVSEFVFLTIPELRIQSTGRYRDSLRKEGDDWKVHVHHLELHAVLPGVDAAAGFKANAR